MFHPANGETCQRGSSRYHRQRERAACLKLRCAQVGSTDDEPQEDATAYQPPVMAISKELYESLNRHPQGDMAMIDFVDELGHWPVQLLKLATQLNIGRAYDRPEMASETRAPTDAPTRRAIFSRLCWLPQQSRPSGAFPMRTFSRQ